MRNFVISNIVRGDLIPDVSPEMPPGMDGAYTLLDWIAGGVIFLGVAAFVISAGILIVSAFTGREINGFKGLIYSIIGSILATAVGVIMRTFV